VSRAFLKKYKDPRWQRKRVGILERADYHCEWCGADTLQLHVHHGYYSRNANPWDYDDATLWCLCEKCHDKAGETARAIRVQLGLLHPKYHKHVLYYLTVNNQAENEVHD